MKDMSKKIIVTELEIIVTGTKEKPYFEIKYMEAGQHSYHIGYSSYDLNNVFQWREECFEVLKEDKYNNGWIACTDRLPTREEYQRGNGRFLVTDGNRTYEAEFDIYESHTFGKSRMSTDWFVTDKCVTHWQNEPLPPKPYQPNGE